MYIVVEPGVKPHFCSNYYLAQEVRENLIFRRNDLKISEEDIWIEERNNNCFKIDFVGSITNPEDKHVFSIGNIQVDYSVCHIEAVNALVKNSLISDVNFREKYNSKFFKMHTRFGILCLSPSERDIFLREFSRLYNSSYNNYRENIAH